MKKTQYFFLLPLASGILCSIAFGIPQAWPLVFVAFVPLLFFLARTRRAFTGGFFFGLVFFGAVLFWFFDSHPLDWAGVTDLRTSLIFVSIAWASTIVTLSIFVGMWAAAFRALRRGTFFDIWLGASLWVVFEWLRTFGFSLLSYSDVTFWGAHWTFGNLAYTLAGSPLLPWASVGGMYLLSFMIVAANIALFVWARRRFRVSQPGAVFSVAASLIFVGSSLLLSIYSSRLSDQPAVSVALLHTDFPSAFAVSAIESRAHEEIFFSLLAQIARAEQKPDVVVFPEDSRFLTSFSPAYRAALLRDVSGGNSMVFADAARTEIDGKAFSILSYYDENGRVVGEYRKLLLVPNGEYLPFFTGGLARLFGNGAWADAFGESRNYVRGTSPAVVRTEKGGLGGLFCSEIFSDVLHQALARDGAEVIMNLSSLSFAHRSRLLAAQTRAIAQMRAVETGRFFLRAANEASALVVAPDGTVVAESGIGPGILYADIERITVQTLFTRFGNWMLWLSFALCAYGIAKRSKTMAG